ncbi:hypothetical protein ACHAXH_005851 [Discostella pseudostelligera]
MIAFRFVISLLFHLLFLLPAHDGVVAHADNDDDEWSSCNCPASNPNFIATDNDGDTSPSAKMAYLISVHNRRTIQDAAYLLKALMETSHSGDTAIILIHIDKRVGIASREKEDEDETNKNQFLYHDSSLKRYVDACIAAPACATTINNRIKSNATILEVHSHFSPEWSKWSMNDPTLWAMEYLTYHRSQNQQSSSASSAWDVFVNLSGDTLPVITAHRISQLFHPSSGPLGNTNFVTSSSCLTGLVPTSIFAFPKHSMKRSHYFQHNIPKTISYVDHITGQWSDNVSTPIYFGSQWMALTSDFVTYVIRSMSHPNGFGNVLKETLIQTKVLMTDETFFPTLLMNSPYFTSTIPQVINNTVEKEDSSTTNGSLIKYPRLHSLRYERMDENAPNAYNKYISSVSLYDIPPKFGNVTDGEGPAKPWGPYFLGVYDLGAIRESGALFVRKVSWTVDANLVRMLPVKRKRWRGVSEEREILEWDELPDLRWPELGVKIHDPWVWSTEKKKEKS